MKTVLNQISNITYNEVKTSINIRKFKQSGSQLKATANEITYNTHTPNQIREEVACRIPGNIF